MQRSAVDITAHTPVTSPLSDRRETPLASPEGTSRYAGRRTMGAGFERTMPRELEVSALGMGSYLGDCTDEEDRRYETVARDALESGVNLFDTASNYRCQRSERSLGHAIEEAIAAGVVRRDELVICTKGGYVALDGEAPATREAYAQWLEDELVAPGILPRDAIARGGHSLATSFLAHQLEQSRSNLRVAAIDIYYLHNPEEQLLVVDREEMLTQLRSAFELLEERAEAGVIGGYGCATWTGLRVPPDHRQHLSLTELVGIARDIGGAAHHFRAVQLPINLAMPEAARLATQALGRRTVPLLEAADALGIGVVASAPLMQGRLTTGLPDQLRELFPECTTDAQRALRFTSALPHVTTTLAGMRQSAHLHDNLGAWATPT